MLLHAIKQAFSLLMHVVEMDSSQSESDLSLSECDSEAFFFCEGQRKKKPLKSKRMDELEVSELEHKGTPGKRKRTEKENNITNTVKTKYDSEASCSFTRRQSKNNFLEGKMKNVCHEEPELQPQETPGRSSRTETEKSIKNPVTTEYNSEASYSFAGKQSKENPLVNVCHTKLVERSGKSSSMEMKENNMMTLNDERKNLFRNAKLSARYIVNETIGEGGAGVVYAGVRRTDGKKVAIKFVIKTGDADYITLPGDTCRLPVEVALMERVSRPPRCRHIIQLFEWFDAPNFFILILEWPRPCIDLFKYCENITLPDTVSKVIIHQIAVAASYCLDQGVFHRDIKEENILINPATLDVKLIDFGFGDFLREYYSDFAGTELFAPPEVHNGNQYHAEPTTIWSLGMLLYNLLCGSIPYKNTIDICNAKLCLPNYLSEGSCRLITWCLQRDPDKRPTLQQFLMHDWL